MRPYKLHGLRRGSAKVQNPCRKHGKRHGRTVAGGIILIYRALAEQTVDHQSFLIHTFRHTAVVTHGIHGSIL